MASFNRVILLGNLCREPELRKTPSGVSVVELRMAINEYFKNRQTGERTEKTCYVDVVVWNQQAELCQQYLTKGSPLLVEGRLSYDEWKTPQGETRNRLRITADRIQFVGAKGQGFHSSGESRTMSSADTTSATPHPAPLAESDPPIPIDPTNDDPPF